VKSRQFILTNASTNACSIIATALEQCEVILITTYFDWHAAIAVFTYVSYWLLFVVVVFTLNIMLRQQLSDSTTIFKTILLVATGVIGLLTCVLAGLTAYVNYASPRASRSWLGSDILTWSTAVANLRAAYFSLYLVSILASGGLALATILSLRRERKAAGDLIGWIIALTVAMVLWIIIAIIYIAWYLENHDYTLETSLALAYIMGLAQALSCIFILCIAKHVCWRTPSNTDTSVYAPVAYQPQYAYNGNPNHQTYQYDQAPEYAGTGNPIKA
jgi:hypothetical protein